MALTRAEIAARYRRTPRGAYSVHKLNAKRRGIPFTLTFGEWWALWALSMRWNQRGNKPGYWVMCRRGDIGPYALGNVYIGRFERNLKDARTKSAVVRRHTARSMTVTFVGM